MSVSPIDARELGARLKQVREVRGLTQAEFAAHLGLHFQTYRNYEGGDRDVAVGVLLTLAAEDVSASWLLEGIGPMRKPNMRAIVARAALALDDAAASMKVKLTSKKRAEVLGELVIRALELDADEVRTRSEATNLISLAAA